MNKHNFFRSAIMLVLLVLIASCTRQEDKLTIDFEKYKLENGLEVVLHKDKSDPIVSTAIMYHVGSSREVPGKTGFAHLFEHMLFQESENVPEDEYFKKIQNVGGTLNGFTSNDITTYFEIVPKNALELVLWMESDRMGYFINTVTPSSFAGQQNVVQNEKRQRVDNQPYGHTSYVIDKNIFPENHPYHWQVIGEMEDLQNATIHDVKEFYNKFYGPNNATLVIAGDFNTDSVKMLVEKYFGEIKPHGEAPARNPMTVTLEKNIRLYHEDNFATVPEINMVWPVPEEFSKDAYALSFLSELLAEGKKTPLYKVLVKEKRLTSEVSAYNYTMELAGEFVIQIRANVGFSLNNIEKGVIEAFSRFEKEGITQTDIDRVKASLERKFYDGISSIFYKSLQLAYYNTFMNDPKFIETDIENIKAVTIDDVLRVYNTYIKEKPYVITSFVPKGKTDLIAENSVSANISEEKIEEAIKVDIIKATSDSILKTPSNINRSVEPVPGDDPALNIPAIWKAQLLNGAKILGIEHNELPIVNIEIVLRGGFYLDDTAKPGVANLVTYAMMEGTKNKTPEALEEEIKLLGAEIKMYTANEEIVISATTLSRNFDKTIKLIEEILLEPRWDEEQFELAKIRTINELKQDEASPVYIAKVTLKKLLYGDNHIFANDTRGTAEAVEKVTLGDLKAFYEKYLVPSLTTYNIVGKVSKQQVLNSLSSIEQKWQDKAVEFPKYSLPAPLVASKVCFVDMPGSKQSVINIGYLALSRTNPDFYPAFVMNYKLGGSFAGKVNMILREEKGYTYGARTNFGEQKETAPFIASSNVRSDATLEAVKIFKNEMEKYRKGIDSADLAFTKNALIKSNARRFETLESLSQMLKSISKYDLPEDYVRQEENIVQTMTLEQHKELADKYIVPDKMVYLIVGDAKTQLNQLKELGFGTPLLLKYAN